MEDVITGLLQKIFLVNTADRTKLQIILWWELRRILYNAIVIVSNLISMLVMFTSLGYFQVGSSQTEYYYGYTPAWEWIDLSEVLGFFIIINAIYSLGWIFEIFIPRNHTFGPIMFKVGLGLTLFYVFLPAFMSIIFWIIKFF